MAVVINEFEAIIPSASAATASASAKEKELPAQADPRDVEKALRLLAQRASRIRAH